MNPLRLCHSLLLLLGCALALPAALRGAEAAGVETLDPGPFYGFWQFIEPAGDTNVVIIKRGGRLSCFWSGTAATAIQKGTWERSGNQLTARWETGHVDVFRKLGDNAIERDSYEPGASLLGAPTLTLRGVRVDARIPGSLTTRSGEDRQRPEEMPDPQAAPALPMRNTFIGYWKVDQARGLFGRGREPHFYLQLQRSGDAYAALRAWDLDRSARGAWQVDGDQAVVTWPDGRRDVLRPASGGGYTLASYRARDDLARRPAAQAAAQKVAPEDAQRYFDAGNVAPLTVTDIRGTWRPATPTGRREYLAIEGWGNAYRFPSATGGEGTDPGRWRLQGDRVIITWVDGSKDVIRLAFPNIVQESYGPGQPLTGTPHRTIAVVRTDD